MDTMQESAGKPKLPGFLQGGGEMGERIRNYDWSSSPLGPIESWPQSLRTCIRIMLTSRQPIWIGWGSELIKFYNDPYIDIVGGKHPNALGQPASVVWKEIWREISPMLKQVMEKDQGTYVESQLLIMERNGYSEETYYTFSYTPIPGDDGRTAGMICANSDDTDRIISERQLQTLTQLGKNLIRAKSDSSVISETIRTLNQNRFDFPFSLFYTIEENHLKLSGSSDETYPRFTPPENVSLEGDSSFSILAKSAISTRKMQLLPAIGALFAEVPSGKWSTRPINAIIIPVAQPNAREVFGILVVGLNPYRLLDEKYRGFFSLVTDQVATSFASVHAQVEEKKRLDALAEIDRAKTTFFSNISHEFRTPLTLLMGPIEEILHQPSTTAENRKLMDVAYRNSLRMQKLVNTLLDFSKIEAGRLEGRFTKVDIGRITQDLASSFRSAIEKAGMELVVELHPVRNDVYVDTDMWEKIILNLVSNAFKYSKEGSIHIEVGEENDAVKVKVRDSGIGIPADQLDKIFDRFHRVENTEGRSQEGTGIGLAMVKELVKLHNGTIDVSSQLGKGSTFTILLPFGAAHIPADRVNENAGTQPGSDGAAYVLEATKWNNSPDGEERGVLAVESDPPGTVNRCKILLADDNTDMRDYVVRLLSSDFDVQTATDGEQAYDKTLSWRPDLVLTDIMMPKLDGFGLLKKIRNRPELRSIPVIFLSARAGEESKVEGLAAGADDYLTKPFSAKELVARIKTHVRIKMVREETEGQFYQLFRQAPAFINVLKGPDHRYEFFHPKNKEIHGDVDFTGMTVREALPELEGQGIYEMLDEVYRTGSTVVQNERPVMLLKDGVLTQHYINFSYQPWYDLKGQIQGILNFAIDVTETVASRKLIEESEILFRTLAETIPQLIWMTDASGAQLYASSRWKEYSGITPDSEQTWRMILHPDDYDRITEAWGKSIATGSLYRIDLRLKNKHGEYRWFHGDAEPVYDDKNAIVRWIGSFTDIQEAKEIEKNLESLVAERTLALNRSNEDLQQFAHVASHDLKEPVRKIKTFTHLLSSELGKDLSPGARVFVDKIQSSADRIFSMIDGVLNYSSINAHKQPMERLDLNSIIDNVLIDLELVIHQKKAEVVKSPLPEIEGAGVLILQLFYNIVNNSLKFAAKDRAPVIRIAGNLITENGVTMACITVADNGIGFENEYAEKIFDTFLRLHSKDSYDGTGLGLSLCKKIVERHHGKISAKGKINEGAEFTMLLPVHQSELSI